MTVEITLQTHSPAILEHHLERVFPDLLKFESTAEMEKSAVYQTIKSEVERILNAVVQENFAPEAFEKAEMVQRAGVEYRARKSF